MKYTFFLLLSQICLADYFRIPLEKIYGDRKFETSLEYKYSDLTPGYFPNNTTTLHEGTLAAGFWRNEKIIIDVAWTFFRSQNEGSQNVGDSSFMTTWKLFESDSKKFVQALRLGAKLPNAKQKDGMGTNQNDLFFFSSTHLETESAFFVDLDLGLGILDDPFQVNRQDDTGIFYVQAGQKFSSESSLFFDGQARFGADVRDNDSLLGLGFETKPIKKSFLFSSVIHTGLSKYSPNWMFSINTKYFY